MPKDKNVNIDYTSRDFASIKQDLLEHAERYYSDVYKDFTAASFGGLVLDSVAYVGDILSYYLDYSVNESFLDTAIEFDNIRKHASALGYNFQGVPSSFGEISIFVIVPSNAEGTAPDSNYLPIIRTGAAFTSETGNFFLTEDVNFGDPKAEFVGARFNSTTGATTHFAVKMLGQIKSGVVQAVTADLTNEVFEKFRRIELGPSSITEVLDVFDSEGNQYHEVDNLAQEVVFIETTNKNARTDGVRSILKPHVASRRFIIDRTDQSTFMQFGFGSSDEDSVGLIDPSKIALKMHGTNIISNNSFDPSRMLLTNKLGVSPYNTILTIRIISNIPSSTSAGQNTIKNIQAATMLFENRSQLSDTLVNEVVSSIEVSNDKPINPSSSDISNEELRVRAKAHYATQNRAVTKQDYESLCYNMPGKFGSIKRANIVNDPSVSNRRLSLYVVSENVSGHLANCNQITKNNLKNWLSHYKMLNDHIDIYDAIIINFRVEFDISVDNTYEVDSVLFSAQAELTEYFSEKFYIGEPLYITKVYERLNAIDGVISTNKVNIMGVTEGGYSQVFMDFDEALSRDGTYIKTPRNVILELKKPAIDIKGTVR